MELCLYFQNPFAFLLDSRESIFAVVFARLYYVYFIFNDILCVI